MTLDDLRAAILKLTPAERTRVRAWLDDLDAAEQAADAPAETPAEKLGRLAGRGFADIRKRLREM